VQCGGRPGRGYRVARGGLCGIYRPLRGDLYHSGFHWGFYDTASGGGVQDIAGVCAVEGNERAVASLIS